MRDTMTATRPDSTAHVFVAKDGRKFHMLDSKSNRITEAQFQQHHRSLTSTFNMLLKRSFGWECCLSTLEAISDGYLDPHSMTTAQLEQAIRSARFNADDDPGAAAWADNAAQVLATRKMLEAADLDALPTAEECAADLAFARAAREEAML